MLELDVYKSDVKPTWCPGCGDYGVLYALKNAFARLELKPENIVIVSGIGCSSNLPHFLNTYGFHGVHGRTLPVATGVKLSNHELTVAACGGDGDGYGIGLGHLIHASRRNLDITYCVMNNQIYGLTTGQTSPTSEVGMATKSTPTGNLEEPVNPLALTILSGATFVARGYTGFIDQLIDIVEEGIKHKGFSLVDVISPCVTFNKQDTYLFFKKRAYNLQEAGHKTSDMEAAILKSLEWGKNIPMGIFYQAQRSTYEDKEPVLSRQTLVSQKPGFHSPEDILEEFY